MKERRMESNGLASKISGIDKKGDSKVYCYVDDE